MQNNSLDFRNREDNPNPFYQNKSAVDLHNRRDQAYEDKKKRRELYNKELFGVETDKTDQNKDYNPFYDNSFRNNLVNKLPKPVFIENIESMKEKKPESIQKPSEKTAKDQMIQTDERFFNETTDNKETFEPKKPEKHAKKQVAMNYKPFFEEASDHGIFRKIREDYQDYVRKDGKSNNSSLERQPVRYNLHQGKTDPRERRQVIEENSQVFMDDPGKKYKKNVSEDPRNVEDQRRKEEQRAYAEELNQMIREKKQQKNLEKQKNNLLSVKLLKESIENSPFGRAGCGAPNRDSEGNLLLRKGIFVNDNLILYKDNGSRVNRPNYAERDPSNERNGNESYEENLRVNNGINNNPAKFSDQIEGDNFGSVNSNAQNPQNFGQENFNSQNNGQMNNYNFPQVSAMYKPQYPNFIPQQNQIYQGNPPYYQNMANNNSPFTQNIPQIIQPAQVIQPNPLLGQNGYPFVNNPHTPYPQNLNGPQTPFIPQNQPQMMANPNMQLKEVPYSVQRPQKTPQVPKILDMKQIEREFLKQTEYKRTYKKDDKMPVDLSALQNSNFLAFQEYDKNEQIRRYQEQIRLQKMLYDQIEEKRRMKEEQKKAELLNQQEEEERLKRQREEIMERYNRDMEKRMKELQNIKDSSLNKSQIKQIEVSVIKEPPKRQEIIHEESSEEREKWMDELKRKEEEKIFEIQRQKAAYEEKLEDVNSHLVTLKNQLFSQQNMLNEELNRLKAEALVANEQRFRSQKELENLREDLKRQELVEELRRNELTQALMRNRPPRNYADNSNLIYPKFAKDFNKAYRFHQLNNEYINDSLDNLVQRTNFLPLSDFSKPVKPENLNTLRRNDEEFDYSNSLTMATKVQTLPSSLVKGYRKDDDRNDINAMEVLRSNEERLDELRRLDKSDGVDMQSKLDSLIMEFNKN